MREASPLRLFSWVVVTENRFPWKTAVSNHQGIEFFPPASIPALTAEKSYHLQHVRNFGLTKRRAKRGHRALPFGNCFTYLAVGSALNGIPEVRRPNR